MKVDNLDSSLKGIQKECGVYQEMLMKYETMIVHMKDMGVNEVDSKMIAARLLRALFNKDKNLARGTGYILDIVRGLMWRDTINLTIRRQDEGAKVCVEANEDEVLGYCDWRMPNHEELLNYPSDEGRDIWSSSKAPGGDGLYLKMPHKLIQSAPADVHKCIILVRNVCT